MLTAIYIVFGISAFIIIISMIKTKKLVPALILTALQGIISLIAANFAGGFFGVHVSVNTLSLLISGIGGLPAVIMMFIIDTLFKI